MRARVLVRLLAAMILTICAVQQSIAAGADAERKEAAEKRFQYLFTPIPGQAPRDAQPVRATVIVRGRREFKLILAFRDGSSLVYVARTDAGLCTSHERIEFAGVASVPSVLTVDGPGSDCSGAHADDTATVTVHAGSRTFKVNRGEWRSHGAEGVVEELGAELQKRINGAVTGLSQVNQFVRILSDRLAPLYPVVCEGEPATYVVKSVAVDCGFDALHGEPCVAVPKARSLTPR